MPEASITDGGREAVASSVSPSTPSAPGQSTTEQPPPMTRKRSPSPADPTSGDRARQRAQATAELDEINVAIQGGTVTFHEVSRAWFGANRRDDRPLELREAFRGAFHKALVQFSQSRGGVESAYYCENIEVAAALTDIEQAARSRESVRTSGSSRITPVDHASASAIHVEPLLGQPENWQCKELLFDCLDLHYRALEFLTSQYRKICMRRIFAIITSLLGTLDSRAANGAVTPTLDANEMLCLRTELADTEAYYRAHAVRRAQVRYFLGMIGGVGLVSSVCALILAVGDTNWKSAILLMLITGGIGAVTSAMIRLTRGSLNLDGETGTAMTILLGMFRPLTGAVFAALLYVLIEGGLLTFASVPAGETKRALFFAGLGFAAGFSERIAQIVPDIGGANQASGPSQISGGVIAQIAQQATEQQSSGRNLQNGKPPVPATPGSASRN